jgi:hypothetical protein
LVRRFIRQAGYDPTGMDDFQLRSLAGAIVAASGTRVVNTHASH